ncbi:MAG: carboxypeptidase regulatory-like domain-containing protein [Pyrinomonadaceae bacterium]|nr:carboxypeptidase regulatory-like domain-containing protein [Pyrinomonadaceae bacterium]MBP6212798.1 carboxypeptidase regulatory-like domain-containing protein [Pyrinomonadaceae bacterium]
MLNPSASLEQCRNGNPVVVPCTGSAWVNGNAGKTNSTWQESDFLPYRMLFGDLDTGLDNNPATHVYTVIIGYDVRNSGKHALDYLGTYNSTNAGADPCSGVTGCAGWSQSAKAIPADGPAVTSRTNPNTGLPVVQIGGQNFTMWGGTIRSVAYSAIDGPMTDAEVERQVTITFTAQQVNPVLSWSGHIAWSGDWGPGNAAGGISGSPYHMRLIGLDGQGGNQDRSLSADAVAISGAVIIRKEVTTNVGGTADPTAFSFTATSNFGPTAFSLVDDDGGTGVDNISSQVITSFGAGNTITVTEGATSGWTLANVNCVESGIQDSTKNTIGPASIIVQPYEVVVCTFQNTQLVPSAAPVSINGRVSTSEGNGIRGAVITVTNVGTGETRIAITGAFGYYGLEDLEAGSSYVVSIASKRYNFPMSSVVLTLDDNVSGLDFVATP